MLAGFENEFAAPYDAPGAQRLQHGKLPVIQLRKGDALGITVKLLIAVKIVHGRNATVSVRPALVAGQRRRTREPERIGPQELNCRRIVRGNMEKDLSETIKEV